MIYRFASNNGKELCLLMNGVGFYKDVILKPHKDGKVSISIVKSLDPKVTEQLVFSENITIQEWLKTTQNQLRDEYAIVLYFQCLYALHSIDSYIDYSMIVNSDNYTYNGKLLINGSIKAMFVTNTNQINISYKKINYNIDTNVSLLEWLEITKNKIDESYAKMLYFNALYVLYLSINKIYIDTDSIIWMMYDD